MGWSWLGNMGMGTKKEKRYDHAMRRPSDSSISSRQDLVPKPHKVKREPNKLKKRPPKSKSLRQLVYHGFLFFFHQHLSKLTQLAPLLLLKILSPVSITYARETTCPTFSRFQSSPVPAVLSIPGCRRLGLPLLHLMADGVPNDDDGGPEADSLAFSNPFPIEAEHQANRAPHDGQPPPAPGGDTLDIAAEHVVDTGTLILPLAV
ncbi:hypothetical protein PG996_015428 [Apiospora saccharicola]|uniref:Uncharacterized protein n=1 Tax=Apiospora saccharicola TaxID=335842 RepID=A0ABR1TL58_9PEZI